MAFRDRLEALGAHIWPQDEKGLLPLGTIRPLLEPTQLAETRFVTYKARDGLVIPAYLTVPKGGAKPHPTVILPHGGPWARDYAGWDVSGWVPYFTSRGYAVLIVDARGTGASSSRRTIA